MWFKSAVIFAVCLANGTFAAPLVAPFSARPQTRPTTPLLIPVQSAADTQGLARWVADFRGRALTRGISSGTFDRAFRSVQYDADAIRRDRNQSEFTKTIWEYLDTAASDTRVRNGQSGLRQNESLLNEIEAKYGVEKEIVVAIWGLESSYGAFRGSDPIVSSLATLAYDGRRGEFFEEQLIAVLKILQNGDITADRMTGSWAGAMGHTQFIPTSYLDYAVDLRGDGRRDIWSDDPTDALASTAAYLKSFGWVTGQPWGVEVRLSQGFDHASAGRDNTKLPSEWAALGVVGRNGEPVRDAGQASVLLPGGAQGAAFLIFHNFEVIERYNTADAYVIAVGHLADRIAGGREIEASWPRGDRALTYDERIEMQERLTAAGFDTVKIDGRVGPLTIGAIRRYQQANGQVPDGYASLRLLENLR
jgi:lytic murein transglycosylase